MTRRRNGGARGRRAALVGALAALLALLWPAAAAAQVAVDGGAAPPVGPPGSLTPAERAERLEEILARERAAREEAEPGVAEPGEATAEERSMPAGPPGGIAFDEGTEDAYQRAWRAYYAYRVDGYAHRQAVFGWQNLSTKITFFVVVGLVLAGVYFAAVQFHIGLRAGREASEVEMSLKGVKVRSSVLGVIVLAISLAFFYLYLVYVYPIHNMF